MKTKHMKRLVFGAVRVGQLFAQDIDDSELFVKTKEGDFPTCMCGLGMNALNLEGAAPFRVHFHSDNIVRIEQNSSRDLTATMFD